MTYEELVAILKELDVQVAYGSFKIAPELPYIVLIEGQIDGLYADDELYYGTITYALEYYFDKKDRAKERQIEDLLDKYNLTYFRSGDVFIEDEQLWQKIYEVIIHVG